MRNAKHVTHCTICDRQVGAVYRTHPSIGRGRPRQVEWRVTRHRRVDVHLEGRHPDLICPGGGFAVNPALVFPVTEKEKASA